MPIDLARPRTIVLTDRGHRYTLTVGPIAKKQWLAYFAGIESTSEIVNGKRVDSFVSAGARLELATSAIVDADGYNVPSGRTVTELESWQQLIPSAHRMAVGNLLVEVGQSAADDEYAITLGFEVVTLDAVWTWNGADAMDQVRSLRHVFGTPTVEHQRRYNRDMSRSVVVGGSRTGKTQWLGAQNTLVELYDELITSVSGYLVDGHTLEDRDEIVSRMDTYHKVAAATALFTPAAPVIAE